MNKKIPPLLAVVVVGGILLALGGYAYFGDTSLRQSRRMKIARAYLPAITNVVGAHPEFRRVTVGVGTGSGGCFFVVGDVDSEPRAAALRALIADQHPPVIVVYRLRILEGYSDAKL